MMTKRDLKQEMKQKWHDGFNSGVFVGVASLASLISLYLLYLQYVTAP